MAKKLSDFQTQKININRHNPRGMGMLDNVIAKDGWISAITVANDGETFAGSARLETAIDRFGDDAEPIVIDSDGTRPIIVRRIDIANADDPRAVRLGIADNRIHDVNADYDAEILASIAEEVDISDMYFDDELAAIVDADSEQGGAGEEPLKVNTSGLSYEPKYAVAVDCETEREQEEIFNRLCEMGYKCKVLTL